MLETLEIQVDSVAEVKVSSLYYSVHYPTTGIYMFLCVYVYTVYIVFCIYIYMSSVVRAFDPFIN